MLPGVLGEVLLSFVTRSLRRVCPEGLTCRCCRSPFSGAHSLVAPLAELWPLCLISLPCRPPRDDRVGMGRRVPDLHEPVAAELPSHRAPPAGSCGADVGPDWPGWRPRPPLLSACWTEL